jgi:hypothetical protein
VDVLKDRGLFYLAGSMKKKVTLLSHGSSEIDHITRLLNIVSPFLGSLAFRRRICPLLPHQLTSIPFHTRCEGIPHRSGSIVKDLG